MFGAYMPPATCCSTQTIMVESPALAAGHQSEILSAGEAIPALIPTHGIAATFGLLL